MKNRNPKYICSALIGVILLCTGCESFLETEIPNNKISSVTVFENVETANSAMRGVYNELFRAYYSYGGRNSVTVIAGISGNTLQTEVLDNNLIQFEQYAINPANSYNYNIWASAYKMIYQVNAILEGLEASGINVATKNRLMGEASFVRAFTYFYLVNLYGTVPLILSTDYRPNATAGNAAVSSIYEQIIADLEFAMSKLGDDYTEGDRSRPNRFSAMALLARTYLYTENWSMAAEMSNQVISLNTHYELLSDLNEVFLANSREALWQISPIGSASGAVHTNEGNLFIRADNATSSVPVSLTENFLNSFDDKDLRYQNWVDVYTLNEREIYFPYKYKIQYAPSGSIVEYSMVLRLAEQYLINAEANAHLGNLKAAISGVNTIRERAGVAAITPSDLQMSEESILQVILQEKHKEFFTEWGHRYLDLKRIISLQINVPNLEQEQLSRLYPIPEQELISNPNLEQNEGY